MADGNKMLIDAEDKHLLGPYTWRVRGRGGYVGRRTWNEGRTKQITIPFHRLLINVPEGMCVDHIDGNPLNNTKSNLRLTTHVQNCWNRGAQRRNKVGFKGVIARGGAYRAQITKNGKKVYSETFRTATEAARAYNAKARELFGEYARLNVIPEDSAV